MKPAGLPVAAPDHAETIRRLREEVQLDREEGPPREADDWAHLLHDRVLRLCDGIDALLAERQQLAASLRESNDLRRVQRQSHELLQHKNAELVAERQQDKERIERLQQAVVSIDYPYPIDIFPDLQERDEVFAAMRAVNRYATEQFASEIARQRGTAARTYLEDGDLGTRQ